MIWRMRTACWIPKATNTHSEYVTLIASPLQQWLHERTSVLRYIYIACIVERVLPIGCSEIRYLNNTILCDLVQFRLYSEQIVEIPIINITFDSGTAQSV
jgi:hypothetical protein